VVEMPLCMAGIIRTQGEAKDRRPLRQDICFHRFLSVLQRIIPQECSYSTSSGPRRSCATWPARSEAGATTYTRTSWQKRARRHERRKKSFRLHRGGAEHLKQTYNSTKVRKISGHYLRRKKLFGQQHLSCLRRLREA